jgi:hypothetical protein
MKKIALILTVLALPLWGLAQAAETESPVMTAGTSVSISSKGTDVRGVLHDLFTQSKKNYVLENLSRTELFLSLEGVEFDEALEIVCRLANLRYEIQNGIYYLSKVRSTTSTPTRDNASNGTASGAGSKPAVPVAQPKPLGKLSEAVLKRTVAGRFTKQDLREVTRQLGSQAQVKVEIDERVPRYKMDFTLNTTSLGYALKVIADRLDLEMIFTENQTILLRPKPEKPTVEKFDLVTD